MRRDNIRDCQWVLTEADEHSPWERKYRLDFSYIRSDRMREEMQDYMWYHYRNGSKVPATLRQENSWLKYYEVYLNSREMDSLFQIRREDAEGFLTFLRTCVSKKTKQPLCLITQKHIYDTVCSLYRWHAVQQPAYLTVAQFFPGNVYQRINRIPRTEYVSQREITQFLQLMKKTKNPCLYYGSRILSVTGLALSDLLNLQTDCIRIHEQVPYLHYYHHRRQIDCMVPVGQECVRAVQKLKICTDPLRPIAPKEKQKQLFLCKKSQGQVIIPDPDQFRYWMRCAYNAASGHAMTATKLRHALIWDMQEQLIPYMVIQELVGRPLLTERGSIA